MIRKIQHLTLALLLAGLALALTLTPTQADGPPTFVAKWGNFGEGAGEFVTPAGIALDSAGNVYVADSGNQRIQKFDGDGNFLRMWGGGVNTGAGDPDICTVAADCQIGTSGDGGAGQFGSPTGIAIDSADNVYIAESGNHRIQKFDNDGNFLGMWGSGVNTGAGDPNICTIAANCQAGTSGNGDGQFNTPVAVDVDSSGNVYVADSLNNRIQKFSSTGAFVTKWSTFGAPAGVAVDSSSNVYVTNPLPNVRIQKFSSTGTTLAEWGSFGINADAGEFAGPAGLTVDSSGNIYISDRILFNRIQLFDINTDFVRMWGFGVDTGAGVFEICSATTTPCQTGIAGNGDGQFNAPADVAVDSQGNVYVVEESIDNSRVQKFEQRLLALTKTVNNDTPRSGERITYTITVHNGGSISATNAVISDTLPGGLTFAGPVGLEGTSGSVAQVAGDLPTLASGLTITNGAMITVTFPVTVNTGIAPNTVITNTAAVTSTEVITPQTGSTLITVNSVNLTLLKFPSELEDYFPNPGQGITYTITVHNSGAISATNAVISDTLPDGLTFAGPVGLEGSNGSVAQDAADLPTLASGLTITNGSTITVTLPVTVDTGQDHGTIIFNTAAVTSDEVTDPVFGLGLTIVLSDTISPTFLIDDLLTGSPLITPTLSITLDTLFPLFEWYAAWDNGQILTYLLTLSSTLDVFSAQSTSISFTTAQTSFVPPIALPNGDYSWTVQAQDAAGNVNTPAIPPQSFSIAADNSSTTYLPIILKNE